MAKIFQSLAFVLITGILIILVGCVPGNSHDSFAGLGDKSVKHTGSTVNNIDNNSSEVNVPQIIDNLKSIEIENLNDENNSKVTLNLPEGWHAKELIFNKVPSFEFNAEKNKKMNKEYSYELYNSMSTDKFNLYGIKGFAGEFYMQAYYRDQPESSRFLNHSQVTERVYSGETVLGQGEIFVLDCDLPRDMRTDQYSTYDMIYVWIPIKDEALAYNLSISVPLGEKDDGYIEMVKNLLKADNQTYINSDNIEWMTMQGGLGITTKVLFTEHDEEKINRIVSMINSGTEKTDSTEAEINVIQSRARPIGICFQLKDGSKAYVWTDYFTKTLENGWSATALNDRFVLVIQNSGQDEYYTIFSDDVAAYLREGWKSDMPMVSKITVSSEPGKNGEPNVIRDGDMIIVSGDGCTSKEVVIHLRRNSNPKEDYVMGKAIPEYGKWEWKGSITKKFKTLDGKEVTLAKDLYDIVADEDGAGISVCGVIDLRKD